MSFGSMIRYYLRTNEPRELADAVQSSVSSVLSWANDDIRPTPGMMSLAMTYINKDNWKHSQPYCSCTEKFCEKYLCFCPTSTEPMVNRTPHPETEIICKCGQPAIWFYDPSDWGCCDVCIDSHRGCSCNSYLPEGIEPIYDADGNRDNPAEDYKQYLDEDGKELPCCEFSSKKRIDKDEQMVRDSVDAYARQLAKLQEELAFCKARGVCMTFGDTIMDTKEVSVVLEPLFKLFGDTVGFSLLLEEAEQHGRERADLPE